MIQQTDTGNGFCLLTGDKGNGYSPFIQRTFHFFAGLSIKKIGLARIKNKLKIILSTLLLGVVSKMAAFLKKFRNKSKSEGTSGFAEDESSKKDECGESPVREREWCLTPFSR